MAEVTERKTLLENLSTLTQIFPHIDAETCNQVLLASGNNVQLALDKLLEMCDPRSVGVSDTTSNVSNLFLKLKHFLKLKAFRLTFQTLVDHARKTQIEADEALALEMSVNDRPPAHSMSSSPFTFLPQISSSNNGPLSSSTSEKLPMPNVAKHFRETLGSMSKGVVQMMAPITFQSLATKTNLNSFYQKITKPPPSFAVPPPQLPNKQEQIDASVKSGVESDENNTSSMSDATLTDVNLRSSIDDSKSSTHTSPPANLNNTLKLPSFDVLRANVQRSVLSHANSSSLSLSF